MGGILSLHHVTEAAGKNGVWCFTSPGVTQLHGGEVMNKFLIGSQPCQVLWGRKHPGLQVTEEGIDPKADHSTHPKCPPIHFYSPFHHSSTHPPIFTPSYIHPSTHLYPILHPPIHPFLLHLSSTHPPCFQFLNIIPSLFQPQRPQRPIKRPRLLEFVKRS